MGHCSSQNGADVRQEAGGTARRPLKRLYTIPEAAIYLGRSTWSIRRLIWDGALPTVRAGGRVHVDVADMDQFIDRHKTVEPQ